MEQYLYTILEKKAPFGDKITSEGTEALESGKVLFLPKYPFDVEQEESKLISESILAPGQKNISYNIHTDRVNGLLKSTSKALLPTMQHFLKRYVEFSLHLVINLLPDYKESLIIGRTSYRPAEILGRHSSKRQDDTRLHVDSFPATPVQGRRILRVFTNVNPYGLPRVWNLGDSFPNVLSTFKERMAPFKPTRAKMLYWMKATKSLRSAYDHYMLQLHDAMKLDDAYQNNLSKKQVHFPADSSWIVFTDQVSHAALSGQFVLEQTFYVPVQAMQQIHYSPMKQWEQQLGSAFDMM